MHYFGGRRRQRNAEKTHREQAFIKEQDKKLDSSWDWLRSETRRNPPGPRLLHRRKTGRSIRPITGTMCHRPAITDRRKIPLSHSGGACPRADPRGREGVNCPARDRTTAGPPSRFASPNRRSSLTGSPACDRNQLPWSCVAATVETGRPQGFQHGGSREDVEGHRAECKLRFARSALNPYSVALGVLPASSVLKSFLPCGRHRKQRQIQEIALSFNHGAQLLLDPLQHRQPPGRVPRRHPLHIAQVIGRLQRKEIVRPHSRRPATSPSVEAAIQSTASTTPSIGFKT